MLQTDTVHLYLRFDFGRERVRRVSVWKATSEDEINEENDSLTLLLSNVSARYCTPTSPIWFSERRSSLSVCTASERRK